MTSNLIRQHLFRAWKKHWPLQLASVTVMTLVLMILNLLFLGYSAFNSTVEHWGQGLEMIVYMRESARPEALEDFRKLAQESENFERIEFTSKEEATRRFLPSLGADSLELLNDPKWKSPLPSSFELKLASRIPMQERVATMQAWSRQFKSLDYVEDVFYGQGWVENFSRFISSARGLVAALWILSLSVGLLIISNCIRLSFLQRRDEIEILELVGATPRFIRTPFHLEGVSLGLVASFLSLILSYILHSALLAWVGPDWSFWLALQHLSPLKWWYIAANVFSGVFFGTLGAWNCVRRLNTGWSAAVG
ncbi:MAG: cell division protein FtsX [Bdellovibrionales bacterium]